MSSNTFIKPEQIIEDSGTPKYVQIYTQLKKELFFNKYEEGSRFYSLRELKQIYKANPRTLRSSIERLINDNYVENRPASGVYVNSTDKRKKDVQMGNIWFYQPDDNADHPYFSSILKSLQSQAGRLKMNLIVSTDDSLADFERWFSPETGDGLVVTGDINEKLDFFSKMQGIRYMVVGNYDLPEGIPNLHTRVNQAVEKAIITAAEAGRKRLGVIAGPLAMLSVREIMSGVKEAVSKSGIELIEAVNVKPEDGYKGFKLLKEYGIDTLFASELAYFGACRYIFENNIKCPEDLFVIRYGANGEDDLFSDVSSITMSTAKEVQAEKIIDTLFRGGPAFSEIDIDVNIREVLHERA